MRFSILAAMLLAFGLVTSAQAASFTVALPAFMTVAQGGSTTETIAFTYTPSGGDPATVQLKGATLPIRVQAGTGGPTLPSPSTTAFDFTPSNGYIFDSLSAGAGPVSESGSFTIPNVTTYQGTVQQLFNGAHAAAPHANGSLMDFTIEAGPGVPLGTYLLDFEGGGKTLLLAGFTDITAMTTFTGGVLTVTPEPAMIFQIMGIFGVAGPVLLVRRWRNKRRAAAA